MPRNIMIALFTAIFWLTTCAERSTVETGKRTLPLAKTISIHPGTSTKSGILKTFGEPESKINLGELSDPEDDGEVWRFKEDPLKTSYRIFLYFKKNSSVVSSVSWKANEGDKEQSIEVAKQFIQEHFKGVRFKERDEGWINDAYSDMKFFEDPKKGIRISYRMQRKEVWSITWSEPKFFAAMIEKQKRQLSSTHYTGDDCE